MGRATLAGCLHLSANGTGKTPGHVLGREGLSRALENRELFEELMEVGVQGPGESSRGRPMVSCPRLPCCQKSVPSVPAWGPGDAAAAARA